MEFLEFLNLDNTTLKKCSKVRSWYLYEQFKSLERNQLDAAQRLKERSLQEKILLQELSERRERRRFCDEGGAGESEARSELRSDIPNDDPMELHIVDSKDHLFSDGTASHTSMKCASTVSTHDILGAADRHFPDDCTTAEGTDKDSPHSSSDECCEKTQDDGCTAEQENLHADNIERQLYTVKDELETMKEELECIQSYTKLCEEPNLSDLSIIEECDLDCYKPQSQSKMDRKPGHDACSVFFVWSKLVSFAYQIMQLTHGNCYYDYSTQFLTAILACDILRRGLCKMSDCLQPYTCPVKLPEDPVYKIEKNTKNKKKFTKKQRKHGEPKKSSSPSDLKSRLKRCTKRKACSEYQYRDVVKSYNWTDDTKVRRHSEPWNKPSTSSFWRKDFRPYRAHYRNLCRCCKHTINPMMKLSHFIDKVVSEIMSNSSSENS